MHVNIKQTQWHHLEYMFVTAVLREVQLFND